jgi:pimeloyl-ACP methyl ester carboxylesterase
MRNGYRVADNPRWSPDKETEVPTLDANDVKASEKAVSRGSHARGEESRFDVRSADGTSLAVWVDGDGPAFVLVHGSLQDHTISGPLVDELREGVTTFSMDRRGFGASGDTASYSIEREFEDVAAVVDAVAARTGGPVGLWGHSYGASCAMGGAALTNNVHHLMLYEPSLGLAYPAGSIEAVEEALAEGDMEAAIILVFVKILEMTEEEVDAMRSSPLWPSRLATASTVPRECRAEQGWVYQPGQFDGITAPTLLLSGSASPPVVKKATDDAAVAIAHAQIRALEGHGHIAHRTDPAMVAAVIRQFIMS